MWPCLQLLHIRRVTPIARIRFTAAPGISSVLFRGGINYLPAGAETTATSSRLGPPGLVSRHREPINPTPDKAAYCCSPGGGTPMTSSVNTLKPASLPGPNEVTIATSVASRPRAIKMRPMRGVLWRASNVYQRPPR
jgi:hypothetical protein